MAESKQIKNLATERERGPVTEASMQEIHRTTKAALDAQPKYRVRLPKERKGDLPYEIVGVNGYNYMIKKGTEVEIPETVFIILQEAQLI